MTHDPLCRRDDIGYLMTPCICDVIDKVRDDQFEYKGDIDTAYGQGWDEALDAAREAVVALPMMKIAGNFPLYDADEVIAAIDALKEKP